MRAGVLTVSDRAARGEYADAAGPAAREFLVRHLGADIAAQAVVPDEAALISSTLKAWCDQQHLDLIVTTGGTGFAPRDVTPEATRAVIEREAPGLAEAMRAASLRLTPHAMLSRALCGIRGRTLILNLPGRPQAVKENLQVIVAALPHALQLLSGQPEVDPGPARPQMA